MFNYHRDKASPQLYHYTLKLISVKVNALFQGFSYNIDAPPRPSTPTGSTTASIFSSTTNTFNANIARGAGPPLSIYNPTPTESLNEAAIAIYGTNDPAYVAAIRNANDLGLIAANSPMGVVILHYPPFESIIAPRHAPGQVIP